jgi:PAS fold
MNQPIPQPVALLLSESQRKVSKKNAKRVANRKSASTSRARKKALVEEMTKTNARLKRQAMILALLPDLVITTNTEGDITFCSAQVERILQYRPEDLLGAKLYSLLLPSSQNALKALIDELINPGKAQAFRAAAAEQARRGKKRRIADARNSHDTGVSSKTTEENANGNSNDSARNSSRTGGDSSGHTSGAAVVSEQSFPLSVVEVESKQQAEEKTIPICNGGGKLSTLETFAFLRSSYFGKLIILHHFNSGSGSGEDDGCATTTNRVIHMSSKRPKMYDSSSLSSEAKNLRANDNLDRNVRWHNQRMLEESKKNKPIDGPKDDVTGASVTANNASARLSSLKHVPERSQSKKDEKSSRDESTGDQSSSDDSLLAGVEEKKKGESASDDSGYRESNDSREEMSSSGSDTSQSNGKSLSICRC